MSTTISAAYLKVESLTVNGTQAGAIDAANLNVGGDFVINGKLSAPGGIETVIHQTLNRVTDVIGAPATVMGSRKVAKSPFHLPTPRGKYAVDLHNIVTWRQTQTAILIKKSKIAPMQNTAYELRHPKAELVSTNIIPDGSGYSVPTKYGTKRLALEDGDCFYDSSKKLFMTPPMLLNMDIYMPSTRNKNEEFQVYTDTGGKDSSGVDTPSYYMFDTEFDQSIFWGTSTRAFFDDIAPDSVYQAILKYNYDAFTNADYPRDSWGKALLTVSDDKDMTIEYLKECQQTAGDSPDKRYKFIGAVFGLFGYRTTMPQRFIDLLDVIKATGGYTRFMSFKWNVKVHTEYTDKDGVISTDIASTTRPTVDGSGSKFPFHMSQHFSKFSCVELASRGIITIHYAWDYFGGSRLPINTSPFLYGARGWSGGSQTLECDANYRYAYTSNGNEMGWNHDNEYNCLASKTVADRWNTGCGSIEYTIELLRSFYNYLVERGLTSFLDTDKVSTSGSSGSGAISIISNIIMEKYKSTFPMKFVCALPNDTAMFSLPYTNTDANGNRTHGLWGEPNLELSLNNGFSIPTLVFDQVHHGFSKDSLQDRGGVGTISYIQNAFRKTKNLIRSECMYNEFGDMHGGYDSNPYDTTYKRQCRFMAINPSSNGIDYPDDAYNNLTFNESLVSTENDTLMMSIRMYIGLSLFICRHTFGYRTSKEMIAEILPGTTTISPFTLEEAAETLDNAIITTSVMLPKQIKTYDNSVYDFVHTSQGSVKNCYDMSKVSDFSKRFQILVDGKSVVNSIKLSTKDILYDDTSHIIGGVLLKTYIPHATPIGRADTSGITFTDGSGVNGSWGIAKHNDAFGNSVDWFVPRVAKSLSAPLDGGKVVMSITIPVYPTGVTSMHLCFNLLIMNERGDNFIMQKNNYAGWLPFSGQTEYIDSTGYGLINETVPGDVWKFTYSKNDNVSNYDDVAYMSDIRVTDGVGMLIKAYIPTVDASGNANTNGIDWVAPVTAADAYWRVMTLGDKQWFVSGTPDKNGPFDSLISGGFTSSIMSFTAIATGTLSFTALRSSELDYDFLQVYKGTIISGSTPSISLSGTSKYEVVSTLAVTQGDLITFKYIKDMLVLEGDDLVYIKDLCIYNNDISVVDPNAYSITYVPHAPTLFSKADTSGITFTDGSGVNGSWGVAKYNDKYGSSVDWFVPRIRRPTLSAPLDGGKVVMSFKIPEYPTGVDFMTLCFRAISLSGDLNDFMNVYINGTKFMSYTQAYAANDDGLSAPAIPKDVWKFAYEKNESVSKYDDVMYLSNIKLINAASNAIIKSYIPHADLNGNADTSGIDWVIPDDSTDTSGVRNYPKDASGNFKDAAWRVMTLGDGNQWFVSGTVDRNGPLDYGSSDMSLTSAITGKLSFSSVCSVGSESAFDLLKVYKGTVTSSSTPSITLSGSLFETVSNLSVTVGDLITFKYIKDGSYSSGDDLVYIKDLKISPVTSVLNSYSNEFDQTYVPRALTPFSKADTPGITFTYGSGVNGSWGVVSKNNVDWFVPRVRPISLFAPLDDGKVVMSFTIPANLTTVKYIYFDFKYNAQSGTYNILDRIEIYRNNSLSYKDGSTSQYYYNDANIGDKFTIKYVKDASTSSFDDVVFIRNLLLFDIGYNIIKDYAPSVDENGNADTSGIDWVIPDDSTSLVRNHPTDASGNFKDAAWKVMTLGDGKQWFVSGTVDRNGPYDYGSSVMSLTSAITGTLSFSSICRIDTPWDFLKVYKGIVTSSSIPQFTLTGNNNTEKVSNLNVTAGELITFKYIKDDSYSDGDDLVYIRDLKVSSLTDSEVQYYVPSAPDYFSKADTSGITFTDGSGVNGSWGVAKRNDASGNSVDWFVPRVMRPTLSAPLDGGKVVMSITIPSLPSGVSFMNLCFRAIAASGDDIGGGIGDFMKVYQNGTLTDNYSQAYATSDDGFTKPVVPGEVWKFVYEKNASVSKYDDVMYLSNIKLINAASNAIIKSYIPHADLNGNADTLGIDWVIPDDSLSLVRNYPKDASGNFKDAAWKVMTLGDGKQWFVSGTPDINDGPYDNGSSVMSFTAITTGTLSFKSICSTEGGYDKLLVYKNGSSTPSITLSGSIAETVSSLSVTAGDLITFKYTKDSEGSSGDDLVYIRDICVRPTYLVPASINKTYVPHAPTLFSKADTPGITFTDGSDVNGSWSVAKRNNASGNSVDWFVPRIGRPTLSAPLDGGKVVMSITIPSLPSGVDFMTLSFKGISSGGGDPDLDSMKVYKNEFTEPNPIEYNNGQTYAIYDDGYINDTVPGDVWKFVYEKNESVSNYDDVMYLSNIKLREKFSKMIIKDYTPHADSSGNADTSGIDWVIPDDSTDTSGFRNYPTDASGNFKDAAWRVITLGDGNQWFVSGTVDRNGPLDYGSSVMSLTAITTGILSFSSVCSTEGDYDKLLVYKNGSSAPSITLSGSIAETVSNLSVTAGDLITFKYIKDFQISSGDDLVYIRDLNISSVAQIFSIIPAVKPKCSVKIIYTDNSYSTDLINLSDIKFSKSLTLTSNKILNSVIVTPYDKLSDSGSLMAIVDYMQFPPADTQFSWVTEPIVNKREGPVLSILG